MKPTLFSTREKLLLSLLGSSVIFSASFGFSYGAVNQSKVDSIMQAIDNAARSYSSDTDKTNYYRQLYSGLSDGIDLLTVIRDRVGSLIGNPPVSVSPGNPANPPGGPSPSPVTITNPIANYPIPAPCTAGVVLGQELMGTANGGWIRREFPKSADLVAGHVYKLRIDESDGQDGMVQWSDAPPERVSTTVKISPYPCDFVTLEQEKRYYNGRITVADRLKTWWDSIIVPADTQVSACMGIGSSGGAGYKIGSSFSSSPSSTCTLIQGVTYYVNVRPSFTFMHGDGCNGTYACNYDLLDGGSQKISENRPFWGGKYSQYTQLRSTENVESLRQKVVNDYKTKGVNTDGLTNTALGGTKVTPPVNTGGPVIVREGPWERTEDIFCPGTLTELQSNYPNGYNYSNQGNTYWNVKNYQNPSDDSLPTSCTTGKKFVKHGMQATCYVYTCKN